MAERREVQVNSKFKDDLRVAKGTESPGDTGNKGLFQGFLGRFSSPRTGTRFSGIKKHLWKRIIIHNRQEVLRITPPDGVDFRRCSIRVEATEDVMVLCSVESGCWEIHFPPSRKKDAEAPVTVNVTVAPPEEDDLEPGGSEN